MRRGAEADHLHQRPGVLHVFRRGLVRGGDPVVAVGVRFNGNGSAAVRVDARLRAPVDEDLARLRAQNQVVASVPVQIAAAQLVAVQVHVVIAPGLEPQPGLVEEADQVGAVTHRALAEESQVRSSVPVEVAGGHRGADRRRQALVAALAPALWGPVVEEGVHVEAHPVVPVAQHQVVASVAVEIEDGPGPGAVGRQLDALAASQRILVDAGGGVFQMALAVAEHQVHVAVAAEVVLVDALEHPGAGDVEIVAAVSHGAAAEGVESARQPGVGRFIFRGRWHVVAAGCRSACPVRSR